MAMSNAQMRDALLGATQGISPMKTFGTFETAKAEAFVNEAMTHISILPSAEGLSIRDKLQVAKAANVMATAWEKDPAILDKFESQLRGNSAVMNRFKQLSPVDAAYVIQAYPGNPRGLGPAVDAAYYKDHARPTAAPKARMTVGPPAGEKGKGADKTDRDLPPTDTKPAGKAKTSPADTAASPVVVAAGSAGQTVPSSGQTPATATVKTTPSATATSTDKISGEQAAEMVDAAATQIQKMYAGKDGKSPFDSEIETLGKRLADPAFCQKIADAMNKNPELVASFNKKGGMDDLFAKFDEQDEATKEGIRKGLSKGVGEFLRDPTLIANEKFKKDLEAAATTGGVTAKINGFLQGFLGKDFDLSKMLDSVGGGVMSFLNPLITMVKNFFNGLNSGGDFISMTNGSGGMFSSLVGASKLVNEVGQAFSAAEEYQLMDARVVDRNKDKVLSDGYEYGADGKRVQVTIKRDGKEYTEDKYDKAKDDRIDVVDARGNTHRVFDTRGLDAGTINGAPVKFYVTRVSPEGQPLDGENIFVQGEAVTRTNAITNRPVGEETAPQNKQPGQPGYVDPSRDPNAFRPQDAGMGPGGGAQTAAGLGAS